MKSLIFTSSTVIEHVQYRSNNTRLTTEHRLPLVLFGAVLIVHEVCLGAFASLDRLLELGLEVGHRCRRLVGHIDRLGH